jgi:predicted component of type VI protein secretion system
MLPLVITVQNTTQGSTRRFAFADSPVRIGRSALAELQLTEPFISRWQGTLRFDENSTAYCNLNSTNPTFVNGRAAAADEDIQITTDTVITLGELTLRFVRMPVPEADLRRRGKPKPVAESPVDGTKTQWLGPDPRTADAGEAKTQYAPALVKPASEAPPGRGARTQWMGSAAPDQSRPVSTRPPSERPPAAGLETPARPQSERPVGVSVSAPIRVLGQHSIGPVTAPPVTPTAKPESAPPPALGTSAGTSSTSSTSGVLPAAAQNLEGLHEQYRGRWEVLLRELTTVLENASVAERPRLADQLQRRFPQITFEPGFRAQLRRLGLEARRADIPEIGEWLGTIAEGVLPPNLRLDTGLTLGRILNLLEMLSESFAEINDAQDSVRRRWLGRAPRGSILQSDNGRVILAYLLNPKADWSERAGEVEEALRNVVMHEIALFKATMEGARALLDALSPEALAKAANVNLEELEEDTSGAGFWQRLKREDPKAALWQRFVDAYDSLKDGARFQRVFMGRQFARTYLAAMGQSDSGIDPPSEE